MSANTGNGAGVGRGSAGDALVDAIADAVALRLENMAGCTQRLMEIDQAAEYLGMTPAALRHKNSCGEGPPSVKIDSKLRYDRRDLDRYIDRARREGVYENAWLKAKSERLSPSKCRAVRNWYIRYTVPGEGERVVSTGTDNEREARRQLNAKRKEIDDGDRAARHHHRKTARPVSGG